MIGLVSAHPTTDPFARLSYFASVVIAMTPIAGAFWAGFRHHEKKKAEALRDHTDKVDKLHDAIVGVEPTLDNPHPQPGILQRLVKIEQDVTQVKLEVTPNGGNTNRLGDRVKRLEESLRTDAPS